MSDINPPARTITHQGRDLRLSLPCNDLRSKDQTRQELFKSGEIQSLDIEAELQALTQTVEIFPDNANDKDMRVVCSVADRAQWDQKMRQIKERRLQEMGVGTVTNIVYNAPLFNVKPRKNSFNAHSFWTGLHTPAVSTDAAAVVRRDLNDELQPHAVTDALKAQSISAQIANLKARHHEVSKSVSQIIACNAAAHVRSLSQRDIIHKRLNSIAPMIVRNASRVVSTIESIPEESEDKSGIEHIEESSDQVSLQAPIATNPFRLHQHLASNDMSELIRPGPNFCMPNFDAQYESFRWADEPLESTNFLPTGLEGPFDGAVPPFDFAPDPFAHGQLQAPFAEPEQYYFYPQSYSEQSSLSCVPIVQEIPAVRDYQNHGNSRSSFNTQAEEFIPFSQAIVRPNPESQAIPIVRPPEALSDDEGNSDSGVDIDETFDKERDQVAQSDADPSSDAYNGFDSGSEDSSDDSQTSDDAGHTVEYQSPVNDNDERVRSFRFPSPEKHNGITPSRPRSNVLNSASPEERVFKLATSTLPPPKMASTPRKSPKIFQKSVEMGDAELDSIIMNLSVREHPGPAIQEDFESDSEEEQVSLEANDASAKRPVLQRVPSTKLLLSHEDADMGLLLDAMLSAKLASVTESMSGLQASVAAIEQQLSALAQSGQSEQTQAMLESLARQLADLQASHVFAQISPDYEELNNKIIALEEARAQDDSLASQLRQELWAATSELERLRALLPEEDAMLSPRSMENEQAANTLTESPQQRIHLLETTKATLQKTVGDLTTKASRLEGRLHESTTFCSALQSQYSASELSLARLRKELNEVQAEKDEAIQACSDVRDRYELLKEHMQGAAEGIAAEQSRWVESDRAKDTKIAELTRLVNEGGSQDTTTTSRRSSAVSISMDTRMTQYLMDRVKSLEHANQHLQTLHRDELQSRDDKYQSLMQEWQRMSTQSVSADATIDGLRAELVMSTEFGDRMMADLRRSHAVIETLTMQLRKAGPVSILKRSRSDMHLGTDTSTSTAGEQIVLKLVNSLNDKDNRIQQLENMLNAAPDSTERQLLSAACDNIVPASLATSPCKSVVMTTSISSQDANEASILLKERVKELKRMRMSWEAKAPVLLAESRCQ